MVIPAVAVVVHVILGVVSDVTVHVMVILLLYSTEGLGGDSEILFGAGAIRKEKDK